MPRALLITIGICLLTSCASWKSQTSSQSAATYQAKSGNMYYLYSDGCDYPSVAKDFPFGYALKTQQGNVIDKGCYVYYKDSQVAILGDSERTVLDFSKKPTDDLQQNKPTSQSEAKKSEPQFTDSSDIIIKSEPAGAKILSASGQILGVTPHLMTFRYRADKSVAKDCYQMPKFRLVWTSGAELVTNEKDKICLRGGRFVLDLKRPMVAGLQADIDYADMQKKAKAQLQQANKTGAREAPKVSQPVAQGVSPFTVTSDPPGAKVISQAGELGVTPASLVFKHSTDNADSNSCFKLDRLKLVWASGAEFVTNEKHKICLQDGRFALHVKRPKVAGLQIDIDYAHKQAMLKIQQEELKLKQQQAEQQRVYMQQQAEAQRRQAEAMERQAQLADDALTYEMFAPKSDTSSRVIDINGNPCLSRGDRILCP